MKLWIPILCALTLLSCAHVSASEIPIEYVGNYDGDTITVNLTGLKKLDKTKAYSLFWEKISVRLGGIDTPEMKGKCPQEKELAKQAKLFVSTTLRNARKLTLDNIDKDKYFRILGEIYVDDVPLAQMMIEEGYAVPYDGGTKENVWCKNQASKAKRKNPR